MKLEALLGLLTLISRDSLSRDSAGQGSELGSLPSSAFKLSVVLDKSSHPFEASVFSSIKWKTWTPLTSIL